MISQNPKKKKKYEDTWSDDEEKVDDPHKKWNKSRKQWLDHKTKENTQWFDTLELLDDLDNVKE